MSSIISLVLHETMKTSVPDVVVAKLSIPKVVHPNCPSSRGYLLTQSRYVVYLISAISINENGCRKTI